MKRFLFIFGILIAILAIVVVVYFLFFRTPTDPEPGTNGNPFGGTGAGQGGVRNIEIPEVGVPVRGAGEEITSQFIKITDGPVAQGSVVFHARVPQEPIGTSTTPVPPKEVVEVRYVERGSGNIYRFQPEERLLERLTNLTLPGVQYASWASDGSRAFVRFLSDETGVERLETYSLPADGSDGYFLEAGLSDVLVTGTSSVLSVLPSTNGSVGTRSNLLGGSPATVFTSPLSALHLFLSGNNYVAATKASALLPGYAFSVNRTNGEFTRLLGPLNGLSILPSPSGTKLLYSFVTSGTLRVSIFDSATGESTPIPVVTVSEKCVWTNDSSTVFCAVPRTVSGTLPDDWYLGVEATSDRVWKIDLATRIATLEFDPSFLAETDIDVVAPTLDARDDVMVFTNKNDSSLWLYDL